MNETARNLIAASCMILVIAAAIPAAASCRGASFNEPQGFRGITWGTPLSAVGNQMTPLPNEGPGIYRRANDKIMIGDAQLVLLVYEFYHGSFSSAYFQSAPNTGAQLIAAFAAQFGNCYTKLDYEDTYVWLGGFVGQVYLKCRPLDHHCIGDISSVTANKQKEVDKAAGAARARRDF